MTTDSDLEVLFNRLADGLGSEVDEQRRRELLRTNSEARRAYRQFMALHSALHWDFLAAASPEPLPTAPAPAPATRSRGTWVAAFVAGALVASAAAVAVVLFRPVPIPEQAETPKQPEAPKQSQLCWWTESGQSSPPGAVPPASGSAPANTNWSRGSFTCGSLRVPTWFWPPRPAPR